jgi:hypothetical protein
MAPVSTVTRLQVGLYGFVFHLAAAGLFALKAARTPGGDPRALIGPAAAAAVAALVVYALLVAPYAQKRFGSTRKGVALYDFLIGMLAELAVVAVAALLFGAASTAGGLASAGAGGWLAAAGRTTAFAFLWIIATAMTEVLVLGNAAGFVGFIVLKKLAARRGAPAKA